MNYLFSVIIRVVAFLSRFYPRKNWKNGDRLRILLSGYNGTRNTGADARVQEIIRQLHLLFGKDIDIGLVVKSKAAFAEYTEEYTETVRLIEVRPALIVLDVLHECSRYHMAILCEGSTLKSKFANALTLLYCLVAGIMRSQNKPCLAYGSEAGDMDAYVRNVAASLCRDTYFIARTQNSLDIIRRLGLIGHVGTDTAWSFPVRRDLKQLFRNEWKALGWDPSTRVVGIAPINPFWWPVEISIFKWIRSWFTGNWEDQYALFFYFSSSKERRKQFEHYISNLAQAVEELRTKSNVNVVILGMEALDRRACEQLKERLSFSVPVYLSVDYNTYELTAILNSLSLLITSRYHARGLSMQSSVPAIAVSMDERLCNVFEELGMRDQSCFGVSDEGLALRIRDTADRMLEDPEPAEHRIGTQYLEYRKRMGEMGLFLKEFVKQKFPDVKVNSSISTWQDAVPQ